MCAEAGAGKTRLLEEVRSRLGDDVQWFEGRAYPYTADIPYAPLVDLFNNAASIDENDSAEQVRDKLRGMVTGLLPGDDLAMHAAIGQLYGTTPVDGAVDLEAFRRCCARSWPAARCRRGAGTDRGLSSGSALGRPVDRRHSSATRRHDLGTGRHDLQLPARLQLGAPNERLLHLSELRPVNRVSS